MANAGPINAASNRANVSVRLLITRTRKTEANVNRRANDTPVASTANAPRAILPVASANRDTLEILPLVAAMSMNVATILAVLELIASTKMEDSNAAALRDNWAMLTLQEDVVVRRDLSARPIRIVTDNWPAFKDLASILARLFRAEPTPIANQKNTPLGADVYRDSKKITSLALVSPSATESCAVTTRNVSSHPLPQAQLMAHWPLNHPQPAPASKDTTEIHLPVASVYPTSARHLFPAKTLKSASLAAVRSDAKVSPAALELVAIRRQTDAFVFRILSVNRTSSAFRPSFHPSVNRRVVPAPIASTDNPIGACVTRQHREILTNRADPKNGITDVTQLSAVSTLSAARESIESIAPVLQDSKEILTSLAKVF